MHGWPYDPRTYDEVVPTLAAAGCRTFVPYLRGFGPTRFLSTDTPRSGQQAALGSDLKDFMDALGLSARRSSAMIGAAAPPASSRRCGPNARACLVTGDGYNIQDIPTRTRRPRPSRSFAIGISIISTPSAAAAGLAANRRESDPAVVAACGRRTGHSMTRPSTPSAASWDNPDFVDVTISSYRHRYGNAPGDPTLEAIEQRLAAQPPIPVPTIALHGEANGLLPDSWSEHERRFTGRRERRLIAGVGHNLPAEAPDAIADAVLELLGRTGA